MKLNVLNFRHLAILLIITILTNSGLLSQTLPSDILSKLNSYNVSWNSASTSGSKASMPLGNGDITTNVWVENNGDLLMYIGKSDCWSEGTRLLKIGRVRINITPNPFISGNTFSQTLNLYKGEIDIAAGTAGSMVNIKVWIDANNAVVRIEASGDKDFSMKSTTEILRPKAYTLPSGSDPIASSFRGVTDGSVKPSESADILMSKTDTVVWYHRNTSSMYQTILNNENLAGQESNFPDPYINRTFGAAMKGTGMTKLNDSTLNSTVAGKSFVLSIYPYTAQTNTLAEWDNKLQSIQTKADTTSIEFLRNKHYDWWDAFWNRSWIFVSGDADATAVTRGYLLQRFMEACQGRGAYPMKFNGGSLTFDYNGKNGDYRNWGPAIWNQNNRHMYWPLLASGDYDMMMPWFDLYMNMLGVQKAATTSYYGHGGAFFPETYNIFGLFILDDWGWGNTGKNSNTQWIRYHYSGALDVLTQMIDYYDYTKSDSFARNYIIPYATEVIRFFDQHWTRVNGKILFSPANSIEEYWDCTNPTDYIAGLMYTISRLNALPSNFTTTALLAEWNKCLNDLPPIPLNADSTLILPAQTYSSPHNSENPECYTIFPYRIFGIGHDNIGLALNTYGKRLYKGATCWSQDPIQAPLLGLTDLAKKYVADNAKSLDPTVKFPAFWAPKNDYMPDLDNGGALMMGLQNMLIQNVGNKIYVIPSWPKNWSVDYKLMAPDSTSVRLISSGKDISQLTVMPASRESDVIRPNGKQNQILSMLSIATLKVGNPDVLPNATASSGLPVTFTSSDTSVVSIKNGKLHAVSDGTAIITAVQGGNAEYNASPKVTQKVTVSSLLSIKIEAEKYSGHNGIQTEDCAEGTKNLAFINDGDYTYYNNINFGIHAKSIDVRVSGNVSLGSNAGTIEFHNGSIDGELIGTVDVPGTGGWQNWTTVTCDVTGASDTINLYMIFKNNAVFNVNWLQINGIQTDTSVVTNVRLSRTVNGLDLFPNPTTNELQVIVPDEFSNNLTFLVYNNAGKVVLSKVMQGKKCTLSTKSLSAGIYMVNASDGQRSLSKKFLKI